MFRKQQVRFRTFALAGKGAKHFLQPLTLLLTLLFSLFFTDCALAIDSIRVAGDDLQLILPTLAFGLTALHKDGRGALQFLEAGTVNTAITYSLKYGFPDTRPNGAANSFPSGHTSISFASAEFMRKRYGWEYGLPAYAAAALVGYSRFECKAHAIDDIVVGGLIGIGSSYFFTQPYEGWNVEVVGGSRTAGVNFSHTW